MSESSLYVKSEYVIILTQGHADILVVGTLKVKRPGIVIVGDWAAWRAGGPCILQQSHAPSLWAPKKWCICHSKFVPFLRFHDTMWPDMWSSNLYMFYEQFIITINWFILEANVTFCVIFSSAELWLSWGYRMGLHLSTITFSTSSKLLARFSSNLVGMWWGMYFG